MNLSFQGDKVGMLWEGLQILLWLLWYPGREQLEADSNGQPETQQSPGACLAAALLWQRSQPVITSASEKGTVVDQGSHTFSKPPAAAPVRVCEYSPLS